MWHVGDACRRYVLLARPPLTKIQDRNDSPIWVNKTQQHTRKSSDGPHVIPNILKQYMCKFVRCVFSRKIPRIVPRCTCRDA